MSSSTKWPDFKPTDSLLDQLVGLSRYYGADPEFVLAGGGNTSVKDGDRLWVKGSGHALASITAEGFVEMDRPALQRLLDSAIHPDRTRREEIFKDAIMAARIHPELGQRPSVEVVLHHLMPRRFVVHTHATLVNKFACCRAGQAILRELLGDQVIWIPDVDPGHVLAVTLRDALRDYEKATGRDCPRAVIMQNHGLVIAGDSPDDIKRDTDWLMEELSARLGSAPRRDPFGSVSALDAATARRLVMIIGPALRGLLAAGESLKVVSFDDSPLTLSLVGGAEGRSVAMGGPLTPDQVVYCRALPMWFDPAGESDAAGLVERLRAAIAAHMKDTRFPPQVILVEGLGLFAAGDDFKAAQTTKLVYLDAIKIMAGARLLDEVNYLAPSQREFFENWEVEQYRRQVAKGAVRTGRASGKIALVTGAAQGFGFEIAQDLAAQGAHVILTDVNVEGVKKAAASIGGDRTLGVAIDVTDGASVEEAVYQSIRAYGGFDLVVSNAGVLKAGSVKTQSEKDFDFVTAVNYKGYFICVQKTAPVLAIQHLAKPDYWSDIIQINSKSGLQGSNRNFAYAGSKFGGIGLTQSFALELVEDGIKVNAICPGNFFDGPLWSDPNTGLFVQYLRSGKVPGAKTIQDVRKAYEAKVPMGRGCTTADVMKAIYYLMEQKYETGQAVPVTGGQVMLG